MKKILTSMSMICMLISASFTAHAVIVDATTAGNWKGYMNVFENDNGARATYIPNRPTGSWGTTDLRANAQGGDPTILDLRPNTNAYADSLRGTEADRVYWTNSDNGGVTPGPDGNKWMEASYFLEAPDNTAWNGQSLTFSGTISDFTLNNRYSTVAFIKTLDVDDGYATVQNEEFSITSTGDFELSLDIQKGNNYVAQMGFTMSGLNANPNTDWGLVTLKNLEAVPEPSTYALLAGFAVFLFVAIRQRK
jgi:hypothetical protein